MDQERHVLFGLMAMVHRQVDPARLMIAAEASREGDFGEELVRSGSLTPVDRKALEEMVDAHLSTHGGDTGKAIKALGAGDVLLLDLRTALDAPSETESIFASLAASASATQADGLDTIKPGGGGNAADVVPAVSEHPGRYDELRQFAAGGMGSIMLVHDSHLGREVALKQLLPEAVQGINKTAVPTTQMLTVPIVARFLQEARITGQLEHPSIVPVYELGYRSDGSLYYTMKLVRGKSMHQALKDAKDLAGRLPLLNHFLDLCYAISYAHTRGVVHRDLKPLNIMIGEFGETIVIDWGIAKVKGADDIHAKDLRETVNTLRLGDSESTAKTTFGQTIGSPYFMPPEQAAGDTTAIDERSDVYALGAVLYHILSGKPPYSGCTVRQFMERVKEFPPKPVREVEQEAPRELAAVCERAMQRDPKDRYQTTKELTEEIQRYLSGGLVSAYEYRIGELMKRFVKKNWRVLATASAGATAVVVVGVLSYFQVMEQRDEAIFQKGQAEMASDRAEIARGEAVEARDTAVAAEAEAVIARDEARRELYFAKIALTPRAIGEQQMGQARNLLGECPEDFRAWEWGYLLREANLDMMTLPEGGRFAQFTPDGAALITGAANGTVKRVDRATGEVLATLIERAGFGFDLDFSADGGRIVCGGDAAVTVWDATGQELASYPEANGDGQLHMVRISADGARVAAVNDDRKLRVWEVGNDTPLLEVATGPRGAGIGLSPDGTQLLVLNSEFGDAGWVRTFELLAVDGGVSLAKGVIPDPLSVHASAFSPDGQRLAMGTDEGLMVVDTASGASVHNFSGRFRHPGTVTFSPDGALLAAGTKDGDFALWNVADGTGRSLAKAHLSAVRKAVFSPDGARLATVSEDRTVKLWSVPALRPLQTLRGHNLSIFDVGFAPDGGELVTSSFDGRTKIWNGADDLTYAKTGYLAFHGASGAVAGTVDNQVMLWDAATGRELRALGQLDGRLQRAIFDQTGAFLATVDNNAGAVTAKIWVIENGTATASFSVGAGSREIYLGPGGAQLFVREASSLSVYDAAAPATPRNYENVREFAASDSGAYFAIGSSPNADDKSRRIQVIALEDFAEAAAFDIPTQFTVSLAFSNGDAALYAGVETRDGDSASGEVHVWDIAANASLRVLQGHGAQINAFAFSDDGTRVATASRDNSAIVWDAASGEKLAACEGHAGAVYDVSFSPGAGRVVTASQDGTFKIWSAVDGREILTLQSAALAAEGQVVAPDRAEFGPDGEVLLTLTAPDPLAPRILRAFPFAPETYAAPGDASLNERVEQYKRGYWAAR